MYNKDMDKVINKATKLEVENIQTRDGYAGADILTISSFNKKHIEILRNYTRLIAKDVKLFKEEPNLLNKSGKTLYIIHGVFSEDKVKNDIYSLK